MKHKNTRDELPFQRGNKQEKERLPIRNQSQTWRSDRQWRQAPRGETGQE